MANVLAPGQAVGRLFEEAEAGSALALAPIAAAVGGSYALLFRTGLRGASVEEAFCHGVDTAYLDRLKEAAEEKLLPAWLCGLAPGSVVDRTVFGTDQQFGRTTFYNHVIRPEGRFHCVIATPRVTERHRFHLIVGRPRTSREFGEEERRLLRLMLPQVSGLLRLQAECAESAATVRRIGGAMDCWQVPVLVVTGAAAVRFANRAARVWLAKGDPIRVDTLGRLALRSDAQTHRLRRAIAVVARDGGDQVFVAETVSDAGPVRLTVKRIPAERDGRPDMTDPDIMVQLDIGEPTTSHSDRVLALARQHDLTRREVALLQHLIGGETLKGAARRLGISYNTGRTYLRQIFEKVDIHRQSDLLRLCVTGNRAREGASPPA